MVQDRPDVKFGIRILLTSDYPKVSPRCFADIDILNYCALETGAPRFDYCHIFWRRARARWGGGRGLGRKPSRGGVPRRTRDRHDG